MAPLLKHFSKSLLAAMLLTSTPCFLYTQPNLSFDFRTLQYLHQKYPAIKTAMLIEGFDKRTLEDQVKALGFTPDVYSPAYQLVNEKLVEKCHRQNIKIIPWTVNDKAKIDELKKMGVDGIITDYPNLFNE